MSPVDSNSPDWNWPFWPVVPLYPYGQRRTLRREIIPEWLWVFDQLQGILYVVVPIRMMVIRLQSGGLFIYAPVAPTPECIRWIRELEAIYGSVRYIILPTVSGIEHKVFLGPFARFFERAEVFVAPDQWSFPVNLPMSWLGFPRGRTQVLPRNSSEAPFKDEFDYAIVGPIPLKQGPFVEVAFFHKPTATLLLTDVIISVPADPPEILNLDPYPLLFHARDQSSDPIEDSWIQRQKGWQRIVLFALYFRPGCLDIAAGWQVFRTLDQAPDRSRKAFWGIYPFAWREDWLAAFTQLSQGGRPLVAPILQVLIFPRDPMGVQTWVNHITSWPFQQILACHMEVPILAGAESFKQAFAFLFKDPMESLPASDLKFLRDLDLVLTQRGIIPPQRSH
jgi:hypothetical protein